MKTVLHIPHASLAVPTVFYDGLLISRTEFSRYNREMTDVGVKELFRDVERYRDDEKEPMAKYGEGAVYTHLYDGTRFHAHDETYRNAVLKYYDACHAKFNETVLRLLEKDQSLLILDCHSFSDKMAVHFFTPPFPDVCIGIEKEYYDERSPIKFFPLFAKKGTAMRSIIRTAEVLSRRRRYRSRQRKKWSLS